MTTDTYQIVPLPKEQWRGTIIPMRYKTEEYYDVTIETEENTVDGYHINILKRKFDTPVCHYPEEYDFPDKLYQDHWEKACAWGIVGNEGDKQELLACIETCPEEWSNRLIVTEIWVHEDLWRKGIGHALMAVAKNQAVRERRRAIILETQSCNVGAISFYRQEGFEIIGLDTCCYSNRDLERKEVRINMGYFPGKNLEKRLEDKFEFRTILPDEADQAVLIEQICFPPNEACSEKHMKERIEKAPELFLVAVDKVTGRVAGFLNGLSTDESSFRDEFFTDADLYDPEGKNIMLLGLDVLPEYRRQGLATEIVRRYARREWENGRRRLILTCLESKVGMYKKMGFHDDGIADSTWGGEEWHQMTMESGLMPDI